MANTNSGLHNAVKNKADEFYTQLPDIEKELKHYKAHFKGKTILCNCDDPRVSNFFKYFALNFESLGLKKLICTCYKNCEPDLFSTQECETAVYTVYEGDKNGNKIPDKEEVQVYHLKGDGDFRSPECIELLKEADICITNPPFSLFREYIATLIKYNKKFLIIGNINATTYKEIFPLLRDNVIWIGYGFNLSMIYKSPYANTLEANQKYVKSKGYNPDENYIKVPAVCWFTNLDHSKRYEELILYKTYNPEEYPKMDNYDAININKVSDIPIDYNGIMAVPITFFDKYCPTQFEILGMAAGNSAVNNFGECASYVKHPNDRGGCGVVNGERVYARLLIRRKR